MIFEFSKWSSVVVHNEHFLIFFQFKIPFALPCESVLGQGHKIKFIFGQK
jgi:hypothetical protein